MVSFIDKDADRVASEFAHDAMQAVYDHYTGRTDVLAYQVAGAAQEAYDAAYEAMYDELTA